MASGILRLIEALNQLDDDNDFVLKGKQFQTLVKSLPVVSTDIIDGTKTAQFNDVVIAGMFSKHSSNVHFNDIKVLYESFNRGTRNLNSCLILFRGIDKDRDGKLNFEEFVTLAGLVCPTVGMQNLENKFQKHQKDNLIEFKYVAQSLFSVRVSTSSSPYDMNYAVLSPHSSACLLL